MGIEISEIISNEQNTPSVWVMRIKTPPGLKTFKAGQFGNFYLCPEGSDASNVANYIYARPFSFASAPDNEYIEIGYKIAGAFTQKLKTLKPNDKVGVKGPYGVFTFDADKDKDVVMLAAGIGIAPFLSALRYATEKGLANYFTLFYSNKTKDEIIYYKDMEKLKTENPNIKIFYTLTQEDAAGLDHGRINLEYLQASLVRGQFADSIFYICGGHDFIGAMTTMLLAAGVDAKRIKKEDFGKLPDS
ncbi:MAG: FAD-dependent oxidoreductase [DPANN group archaeon]|nr:FAD-dependent oxidoreductase [DPANN group archaeon]